MDAEETTAHWDTSCGLLKLPPTGPVSRTSMGPSWRYVAGSNGVAAYVTETGKAYYCGGNVGLRVASIIQYDPLSDEVSDTGASLATVRDGWAAAYEPTVGKVYVFGGMGDYWEDPSSYADIVEFDPLSNTATLLTAKLPYRLADSVAVYAPSTNKVYLFGGSTPEGFSSDILEFDVMAHTVRVLDTKLPFGLTDASAAIVPESNRVYVLGGCGATGVLDQILAYDIEPSTGQLAGVTLPARLPVGLRQSTAAYVPDAGRIFVVGGQMQGGGTSMSVYAITTGDPASVEVAVGLPYGPLRGASAVYAPESDWLVVLGGAGSGEGILRFRCTESSVAHWGVRLPFSTHTLSAVYDAEAQRAYLFGGEKASVLEFDASTEALHVTNGCFPVPLSDPAAVWVPASRCAYVFAGHAVYRYDPIDDTVTTMPVALPIESCVGVHVPTLGVIYLFDSGDGDRRVYQYRPGDGTLSVVDVRLPSARRGAYATFVPAQNAVYLFGGWGYREMEYLDEILVFDVAEQTLTKLTEKLPQPGEFKSIAFLPSTDYVCILGGWCPGGHGLGPVSRHIWQFDTVRHRFVTAATPIMEAGRRALVWASARDRFYAFGGLTQSIPRLLTSTSIDRFDCRHEEQGVAQSLRLNDDGGTVARAELAFEAELNGGSIDFSLSNDGGATWAAVTPGVEHVFTAPGHDLRWRAALAGDGVNTPMIDALTVSWVG